MPDSMRFSPSVIEFKQGDTIKLVHLKKGKVMRLDMQNQFAQEVNFEIPLDGFTKMYDSAGLDPATLQKMREDAARAQQGAAQPGSDELRRRGEELMRQLEPKDPKQRRRAKVSSMGMPTATWCSMITAR